MEQTATALLPVSRKDAKEYLEFFAPWRLGVRQSVGFGCGYAAPWGRPSQFVVCPADAGDEAQAIVREARSLARHAVLPARSTATVLSMFNVVLEWTPS